jgi:hypothetical protein
LSELLGKAAGEPLQDEVSGLRFLFELLGFLLSAVVSDQLSAVRATHCFSRAA